MWFAAAPALASGPHEFSFSFGSGGSGAGQVQSPQAVAVNGATGDIYVADTNNARVDEFDAKGHFVRAWGWGVADGASKFETCTSSCQAGLSGSGAGQFESPAFVAVDNSTGPSAGAVYVGDTGNDLVTKFDASGNLVSSWGDQTPADGQLSGKNATNGPFGPLAGVAVDPSGNLWVYDTNSNMFEFAQDGSFTTVWNSGRGVTQSGIAVDQSDNLYVVTGAGNLEQFSSTGTDIGDVTDDQSSGTITGVAVDPTTGDVYADDGGGTVIRHYTGSSLAGCVASSSCTAADTFAQGKLQSAAGLAFDPTSNFVYAADPGANDVSAFGPPQPIPPSVDQTYVTNVTADSATLSAEINPNFSATHYHFEYVTAAQYKKSGFADATDVPKPDARLGASGTDQLASVHVQGLSAKTTYHYRAVATNAHGTTNGPAHTLTTQPSSGPRPEHCSNAKFRQGAAAILPDCRAYEQVSPTNKNGNDVGLDDLACGYRSRSSTSGDAFLYQSLGEFARAKGSGVINQYVARRTATRWITRAITPLIDPGGLPNFPIAYAQLLFSSDLAKGIEANSNQPLTPDSPRGYVNLYVADIASSTYKLVTTVRPPGEPPYADDFQFYPHVAGTSADFSHVVFSEQANLTPHAPTGVDNVYEWINGKLSLVNIDHRGKPMSGGAEPGAGSPLVAICGPSAPDETNTVSADGARIFFNGNSDGQLYVRENGAKTVEVSASQRATPDPHGPQPALFLGATPDGGKALFTSSAELTNSANTGSADQGADLYQYDLKSGRLTDLTIDRSGNGAEVQGLVGTSTDQSYIYFVAQGVLATGAASGQNNLYVEHAGVTRFIAALASGDQNVWTSDQGSKAARATPDGTHLAFESTQSLTGYDNTDANTRRPDTEVFLYDAPSGHLVCASCNPTGAEPIGSSALNDVINGSVQDFVSQKQFYARRNLSDDGSRLFFTSADALSPHDSNGENDVYEWEAKGTGSCHSAGDGGGCLYLISSGTGAESDFLDASPSGNDVFFSTRNQLVPRDQDDNVDIYDARVRGGLASQHKSPSPPCQGDSCKPPPKPPPPPPLVATITFRGHGGSVGVVDLVQKTVTGDSFRVAVRVPAKGRVRVGGRDLETVMRTVARAGAYRVWVALSERARWVLKRDRTLRVRVGVIYLRGAKAARATFMVTLRR